jgi:hypothetical protein
MHNAITPAQTTFESMTDSKRFAAMSIDTDILVLAWIITSTVLIFTVPKTKIREAILIFFFVQLITWVAGLAVAQFRLIDYPVRSFPNATKASFDFEYFIYPSVCVVFNLHYPGGKSRLRQFMHYFITSTVITIVEMLCERFTNIITYMHWKWYITWITLNIVFYLSRKFYLWYFANKKGPNG